MNDPKELQNSSGYVAMQQNVFGPLKNFEKFDQLKEQT